MTPRFESYSEEKLLSSLIALSAWWGVPDAVNHLSSPLAETTPTIPAILEWAIGVNLGPHHFLYDPVSSSEIVVFWECGHLFSGQINPLQGNILTFTENHFDFLPLNINDLVVGAFFEGLLDFSPLYFEADQTEFTVNDSFLAEVDLIWSSNYFGYEDEPLRVWQRGDSLFISGYFGEIEVRRNT